MKQDVLSILKAAKPVPLPGVGDVQEPAPQPSTPPTPARPDGLTAMLNGKSGGTAQTADVPELSGVGGMLDFLEGKLNESAANGGAPVSLIETPVKVAAPVIQNPVQINGNIDPLMGQGIEISVEIYVEILEAITGSLANWYSGDESTTFNFDKKLKERYRKVTEIYAKTQNIVVSPGFLFGAFTVVLIGQVGIQAHKRKRDILKAEQFRKEARKKVENQTPENRQKQTSLFPDYQDEKLPVSGYVKTDEKYRKNFKVDASGYYEYDGGHNRIPVDQRTEKPSPQMNAFFSEFRRVHGRHPDNKEVKAYVKTI